MRAEENVDTVVAQGAVGPVLKLLTLFGTTLGPKTTASISQQIPSCALTSWSKLGLRDICVQFAADMALGFSPLFCTFPCFAAVPDEPVYLH